MEEGRHTNGGLPSVVPAADQRSPNSSTHQAETLYLGGRPPHGRACLPGKCNREFERGVQQQRWEPQISNARRFIFLQSFFFKCKCCSSILLKLEHENRCSLQHPSNIRTFGTKYPQDHQVYKYHVCSTGLNGNIVLVNTQSTSSFIISWMGYFRKSFSILESHSVQNFGHSRPVGLDTME